MLGKYKSEKDSLLNSDETEHDSHFYKRLNELNERTSRLFARRRKLYFDQFHKLSVRLPEDLCGQNARTLFVSRNLDDGKNTKCNSMGKINNQKFYQITLFKLTRPNPAQG